MILFKLLSELIVNCFKYRRSSLSLSHILRQSKRPNRKDGCFVRTDPKIFSFSVSLKLIFFSHPYKFIKFIGSIKIHQNRFLGRISLTFLVWVKIGPKVIAKIYGVFKSISVSNSTIWKVLFDAKKFFLIKNSAWHNQLLSFLHEGCLKL